MVLDQKALEAVSKEVEVDGGRVAHWIVPEKHALSHRSSWVRAGGAGSQWSATHYAGPAPKINLILDNAHCIPEAATCVSVISITINNSFSVGYKCKVC